MNNRSRHRTRLAAATIASVLAIGLLAPPSAGAAPTPPEPTSASGSTRQSAASASSNTIAPDARARVLPTGWARSADLAWATTGDANGFHIVTASAKSGYTWKTIATLAEPGFDTDLWIGNACLTGSGRRLVVVYAPRTFTNEADLFDRGAFTAVVDLTTGTVRKLPVQSTLAYFNPGCGIGETAVITQLGGEQSEALSSLPGRSRLVTVDTTKGSLSSPITVDAEVTSAIPIGNGIVAAGGTGLVAVEPTGKLNRLTATQGVAFHLHPDADGGVVYLDRVGDQARVQRARPEPGAVPQTLATGRLTELGISPAAAGRVFVTGRSNTRSDFPKSVRQIDVSPDSVISSLGEIAVTRVGRADTPGSPLLVAGGPHESQTVRIEGKVLATGAEVAFRVLPGGVRTDEGLVSHPKLSGGRPADGRRAAAAEDWEPGSPTNPVDTERWCSVPRNDPQNQTMQPKPRQVEWAVDQAITNTPYAERPANWKNLGMPAYSPLALFPRIELVGGGRVPSQVMLGILAQESNLWQATGAAVPGVTANPLIGNFYGRDIYNGDEADDWDIRWEESDCGYGVAQVTDGMRRAGFEKEGETSYPYQTQRAVALDFAVNVAAGARILQSKWNQTRSAGLTVNGGDADGLESWFFALWAYNSGFFPDKGDGSPWGLGWGNNPVNPRYPANRNAFLETSYADAKNPQRWPYPEKVLGFAGHPPDLLEGPDRLVSAFIPAWWVTGTDRATVKPPVDLFCTTSNNCHPGGRYLPDDPDVVGEPAGPCANRNQLGYYDLRCWWHESTQWKDRDQGGFEQLRFDPGWEYQADATPYQPNCSLSGLPAGALVIDDVPDGTASVRPDCGRPWTNSGQFGLQFPEDHVVAGTYPAKVDFHQVGGGFGGHFWFGHTRVPNAEGQRMKVTGTWTLNQQINGWARVLVHIPDLGAHTQQATYEVNLGQGFAAGKRRVVLQRTQEHRWVSLGAFQFTGTPAVRLSTETLDGTGVDDVAWDAIAFEKLPGKPRHQVVALGDSYTSGEGASTNRGSDYYKESDYKEIVNGDEVQFQNVCHRSKQAWPRQAKLSDSTKNLGARADEWDQQLDFQFHPCSGAVSENLLPYYTVPAGQPKPTNGFGSEGVGQYGEMSQLDKGYLDENTTLVVFSIGGNDARFADIVKQCVLDPVGLCQNDTLEGDNKPLAEMTIDRINGPIKASIRTVLRQIHERAPNAKIMLMGYPRLLENHGTCIFGIGAAEAPWLNSTADYLAAKMDEAVQEVKAEGVQVWFGNPIARFAGKAVCGDPETVNGVIAEQTPGEKPSPTSQQSFHPKISGAGIYADVMNDVTRDQMGL
ncbi:SGNH/GDSL hydrolase family protein [Micromonospora sp. NPDC050417]|uniref:SGNH/GDSL hydrolase family protein n=1 Tax=Micromonospora sp. NPDC050417 TaxID=3364280 RepID=UPI00378C55D8